MKKTLIIFAILILAIISAFYFKYSTSPKEVEVKAVVSPKEIEKEDGRYCFHRLQEATKSEPYRVEEDIILNIKNGSVVGTKSGTQNGPDMTNGYGGDLVGSIKGVDLELTYSYTVEGSKAKELEIYKFQNDSLVKMRWVLEDKGGILTPDKVGVPKMIFYQEGACS